jgi:hypothetical protein
LFSFLDATSVPIESGPIQSEIPSTSGPPVDGGSTVTHGAESASEVFDSQQLHAINDGCVDSSLALTTSLDRANDDVAQTGTSGVTELDGSTTPDATIPAFPVSAGAESIVAIEMETPADAIATTTPVVWPTAMHRPMWMHFCTAIFHDMYQLLTSRVQHICSVNIDGATLASAIVPHVVAELQDPTCAVDWTEVTFAGHRQTLYVQEIATPAYTEGVQLWIDVTGRKLSETFYDQVSINGTPGLTLPLYLGLLLPKIVAINNQAAAINSFEISDCEADDYKDFCTSMKATRLLCAAKPLPFDVLGDRFLLDVANVC